MEDREHSRRPQNERDLGRGQRPKRTAGYHPPRTLSRCRMTRSATIFVVHSAGDLDFAKVFALALEKRGFPARWIEDAPIGTQQFLADQVATAPCVVVLWSTMSATDKTVRSLADYAVRRKVYLPVVIDRTSLPVEFSNFHSADLMDWDGKSDDPRLLDLTRAIGVSWKILRLWPKKQETTNRRSGLQNFEPKSYSSAICVASASWNMSK